MITTVFSLAAAFSAITAKQILQYMMQIFLTASGLRSILFILKKQYPGT